MSQHNIEPQKVTKPIQLLAAWLIGLIVIDAAFLAASMKLDSWERSALVVASILNVPIFLFALFTLQTRFRPELQEDAFYSKYLDSKTNQVVTRSKLDAIDVEVSTLRKTVLHELSTLSMASQPTAQSALARYRIGLNKHLSQFEKSKDALKARGLQASEIFAGDDPPKGAYLAIDREMDLQSMLEAISLAVDCGMDGYGYFNPAEEGIRERILIGAYGLELDHFVIDTKLVEFLSRHPEASELAEFEMVRSGR